MSLVMLVFCAFPCLAAEPMITAEGLPQEKLALLAPHDDGFESAMAVILRGKQDPLVEQMEPYGVVLRNDSTRTVVAFWVRFTIHYPDGTKFSGMSYGAVEDLLDGGAHRPESPLYKRETFATPPGEVRFVSWLNTMGQSDTVSDATRHASLPSSHIQAALARNREQWQDLRVDMSLMAAMFDDGEVVGLGAQHTAEQYRDELAGYQSILSDVTAKAASRVPPAAVLQSIAPLVGQMGMVKDGSPEYWRGWYARRLLLIAQKKGDASAIQYAADRMFRKLPDIHVSPRWLRQNAKLSGND